jgi:hypothetical protein
MDDFEFGTSESDLRPAVVAERARIEAIVSKIDTDGDGEVCGS